MKNICLPAVEILILLDGTSACSHIKVKKEKREKVRCVDALMQDGNERNRVQKERLGHFHINLPLEGRNM